MKWMPRWSWENIWSVWSVWTVCSLLVFPFLAAFYTVPALAVGYQEVTAPVIARVVFYGFAWGIAQVLFGLSVERIGMALTFSIVLGSSAAIGTLLPFIRLHSELLFTAAGGFILGRRLLRSLRHGPLRSCRFPERKRSAYNAWPSTL
jgi:L-rhamnose-H+ transport protein